MLLLLRRKKNHRNKVLLLSKKNQKMTLQPYHHWVSDFLKMIWRILNGEYKNVFRKTWERKLQRMQKGKQNEKRNRINTQPYRPVQLRCYQKTRKLYAVHKQPSIWSRERLKVLRRPKRNGRLLKKSIICYSREVLKDCRLCMKIFRSKNFRPNLELL